MADPLPGQIPFGSSVIHSEAVDVSLAINYGNIKNKTILITGGASGFGAALLPFVGSTGCECDYRRHQ